MRIKTNTFYDIIIIRGKGELNLKNVDDIQSIDLESIVPSVNEKLSINSTSQMKAKKLDLYGNSKVEFVHEVGALIEIVTVQQKSTTILENIEISNKLIAGIQTSITIENNVKISAAQIELSQAN